MKQMETLNLAGHLQPPPLVVHLPQTGVGLDAHPCGGPCRLHGSPAALLRPPAPEQTRAGWAQRPPGRRGRGAGGAGGAGGAAGALPRLRSSPALARLVTFPPPSPPLPIPPLFLSSSCSLSLLNYLNL